ncbi:MAG: LytTR family DNA-binding domain-containing protein [Pseudomonadota bacterium]
MSGSSGTFTMREWLRVRGPLGVWIGATILAVAAGPFGTMARMPELWTRAGYWAGVAALSVVLGVLTRKLAARMGPGPRQLPAWIGMTVLIASMVHLTNTFLFDGWCGWSDYLYLLVIVALVVAAVHGIQWLVSFPGARHPDAPVPAPAPDAALQRRLPPQLRAPLVRLEAQDHYTKVVTTAGHTLLLMRLSDAVDKTGPDQGLQVHRSHWVAKDQIRKVGGSRAAPVLEMSDGAQVPISRKRRDAAMKAGLVASLSS